MGMFLVSVGLFIEGGKLVRSLSLKGKHIPICVTNTSSKTICLKILRFLLTVRSRRYLSNAQTPVCTCRFGCFLISSCLYLFEVVMNITLGNFSIDMFLVFSLLIFVCLLFCFILSVKLKNSQKQILMLQEQVRRMELNRSNDIMRNLGGPKL